MRWYRRKIKENKSAVSTILGYALTLGMCSMILVSSVFLLNLIIEKRTEAVAQVEAQVIANRIVDLILDAAKVSHEMPNVEYSRSMRLPDKIGNYEYYVEGTNDAIYVKSMNGRIVQSCSTYNVMTDLETVYGITGKVYSGTNIEIKIGSASDI
jgi:hypothetical protein